MKTKSNNNDFYIIENEIEMEYRRRYYNVSIGYKNNRMVLVAERMEVIDEQ